ncbi:hypothetical protein [Desulfovibrio inopinatus]|uniref:hypothetical protein n=1 Tax=Desulfovibrio inopinatus TaxID=102109 RepID=UPI0004227895|nr:hypothetical protein [Desulfovibrio inopinatus]
MFDETTTVWCRKRRIIGPSEFHALRTNRAGLPVCLPFNDSCWRLWFSVFNEWGQAGALCVDIDPSNDMRILAVHECPGLERGREGAFDSAGLMPSSVIAVDDRILMWYTGMRLRQDLPFEDAIGLAMSEDGGMSFQKVSETPVLAAGPEGAALALIPMVVRHAKSFEMWYSCGTRWTSYEGHLNPQYNLRRAHSPDGVQWTVNALREYGMCTAVRPYIDTSGQPELFFSARGTNRFREPHSGEAYHLYRASLDNNIIQPATVRPVNFVPAPEPEDWDSWMQAYCCVVPFRNTRVMFYTGNEFGRTGFGYAVEVPLDKQNKVPVAPPHD